MTRFTTTCLAIALSALSVSAAAQDHAPPAAQATPPAAVQGEQHAAPAQAEHAAPAEGGDFIMAHIVDSRHLELPWPAPPFHKEIELPHWKPIQIGSFAIDISPTKHVVFMLFAAVIASLVLLGAARSHQRQIAATGTPKGFAASVEALVVWLRNDIILPNVGPHGEKFVPFGLALFFFILTANLLGLLPWGATATSNISVTATLAIISFFVIEIAGMRALGLGYIKTIVYWPHDMKLLMRIPMSMLMTPIELLGKFTKPFALAVRLFANMTGGHIVLLALIGLIFTFGNYFVAVVPVAMSVGIMFLETLVAGLQAFVFLLLVSVFIGQVREAAH
jgi:F-type H+-transporting ATPase subunit a